MSTKPLSPLMRTGMLVLVSAIAIPVFAADSAPKIVKGKVYTVSVQTSFGTTFTDCFRFSDAALFIDGCGDSGPVGEVEVSALSGLTGWRAKVPCGGLNLVWVGTSVDGAPLPEGADMLGAIAVGMSQGTSFAVNGLGNPGCTASAASNGLNYIKPVTAPPKQ